MNATETATSGIKRTHLGKVCPPGELKPKPTPNLSTQGTGIELALISAPETLLPTAERAAAEPAVRKGPPQNAEDAETRRNRLRKALRVLASVVMTTAAIYLAYQWWSHDQAWVKTDNAYVAAHVHNVSARVSGTVNEVLVDENQFVVAGSVLARLDKADFNVRRQQAQGQLAQADAQLRQAKAQIAQAQAQVAREQARAVKAKSDSERANSLYHSSSGAISKQEFEQAQSESDAAQASLEGAAATLEMAQASELAAQAQARVASANLQDAELQLSYTEIVAPTSGRIGKKNLESGNRVQPGQGLLALVQPDVWVTANFKETQLAHLKVGQNVQVTVDGIPGRTFAGKVDSLSPASGAQFALLPPDNATGNFTKIVQRIPVKIVLDRKSVSGCENQIAAGMSAVVKVNVRE